MATVMVEVTGVRNLLWQCKQCRNPVTAEETMAYHLVDMILYGWCESCFNQRKQQSQSSDEAIHPATSYLSAGDEKFARGDYAGAVYHYSAAIESDPALAAAYYSRGNALKAQGNLDAAINDYNKAIELDPRHSEALNQRGNAWLARGRVSEAVADFDRALALDPRCITAYANRGLSRLLQGKGDDANKDFEQCLKINPRMKPLLDQRIEQITARMIANG